MSYDYPTEQALRAIAEWDGDMPGWFALIKMSWWSPEWGWREERSTDEITDAPLTRYRISTGGWSGNEDIIEAMQKSLGWFFSWVQSRRGGHYIFEVPDALESFRLGSKETANEH